MKNEKILLALTDNDIEFLPQTTKQDILNTVMPVLLPQYTVPKGRVQLPIRGMDDIALALYMSPKTGDAPQQIPVEKNPGGGVDFTISGQGGYLRLYCEDGYTPEITIESIAVNGETTDTPVAGFEDQVSVTMKVASEKEDVPLVGTPTGTVTLYNGKPGTDEPLATGTLEDGSATLKFTVDVEDLLAGKIDLYAVYEGDNNYVSVNTADATVISVEESVPAAPAVTAVTADGNPYTSGTWTKQDHVVFTVSGSSAESGIAGYEYSADGGKKWTGITPDAEGAYCLAVPDEGQTTYLFRVVTNAGTKGTATEAFGVKIDRTAPEAAIHVKDNQWTGFLNTITFGKFFKETVDVNITASDTAHASGVEKVEYMLSTDAFASVDQADGDWKELKGTSGDTYSFSIEPNQKGSVYVRVTDHAGNTAVINSEGIVVYTDAAQQTPAFDSVKTGEDIAVSFTEFVISGDSASNYTLTQPSGVTAEIYNTYEAEPGTDYTVNTNDNGWVNEGFVIAAKEGYSLSLTDTADGTWTDTLSASDETDSGEVTFYVKNETTGAISLAKTEDYKIDRTAPVIEGIADGGIYCVSAEFTVNDRNIDKVQINGEDAAAKDGVYTLAAGEYTVTALDKAGNAAEMKVTVREAHDFIWVTDKEPTETEAGLKHEACTVCGYAKDPVEIPAAGQEKPAEPAEPGKPAGDQAGGTGAVQTGDPADSMLWILLMLAAGAAAAGAELYRRKRR